MTVVSLGDQQVLEQIQKQLGKLEDVHDKGTPGGTFRLSGAYDGEGEANAAREWAINAIAEIFRASIL